MNEKELIIYYNKFNEDKRLNTKHGQVEFLTAMKYLKKYLKKYNNPKIIDIGAGTGKYSLELQKNGYDVKAIELVKHNLKEIEKKGIKCHLGNATNLSFIENNSYDITILFGPMYHLINLEDRIKALTEAKRITKNNGLIFISYCMNEYAIITHGFKENYIKEALKNNNIDSNYKIISKKTDLYYYIRLDEINFLKKKLKLKRVKIISQDGPSEYMKKEINKMDEETFKLFLNYHFKTCEKKELLGAGRHILDILKVEK